MTKARPAERSEVGALARLWYDAWQDAHAAILPEPWLWRGLPKALVRVSKRRSATCL